MIKNKTSSEHLGWVVLLLAAAVILPTVCLLWFMTTAVRNERLAVRQKLVDMYSGRARHFFAEVPNLYFTGRFEHFNSYPLAETHNFFGLFAAGPDSPFQGMLIYDSDGALLYPAIAFYAGQQDSEPNLLLADKSKVTTEDIYQLLYPKIPGKFNLSPADIMRYRVYLAESFLKTKDNRLLDHLRTALDSDPFIDQGPAETIIWQLEKLIAVAQQADLTDNLASEIQSAGHRIIAYANALEAALRYPSVNRLGNWTNQTIRRLEPDLDLYGFKCNIQNQAVVGILTQDSALKILTASMRDIQDDMINIQITDNFGNVVIGNPDNNEKPFLTASAGKFLPDFTVSVSFKNTMVFEKAANRQTAIYTWTAILVVLLMLLVGAVSIRMVGRQIRMNRLKNNFVATVTHELKTPLSSMRLLVDTLLDGNYTNQRQCKEYLELISHENERLSRMIDSFLTFSRMERNKQVFDFQPVSPADIVHAAAQAVQPKMNQPGCRFSVLVNENLPQIHADKDAMTTVLVNLMDNAYKYSNPDKTIELKAYSENGKVCFAVKDNGIGISRRLQKKIFDRFFQADSRLSRSAEGCGLGLSIVKFIVNAHKGTIDVNSKLENGSIFTVRIPT